MEGNMSGKYTGTGGTPDSTEEEEIVERPYELRNLKDKDLFPLLKILKKVDIKDFKNAFFQVANEYKDTETEKFSDEAAEQKEVSEESGKKSVKEIGIEIAIDMAGIFIDNIENAEDDIYALWSDISGIPVADMKELEFGTLPLMIMDTFLQARNTSFFKVLSKSLS